MKEMKKSFFNERFKNLSTSETKYQDLFKYTFDSISTLIECPLTLEKLKDPAVLESGHTIDSKFMKRLVDSNKPDPFDRSKTCNKVVTNFVAKDLCGLIKKIEAKYNSYKSKKNPSKYVQVKIEAKKANKSVHVNS
mmetsp:Transcript_17153/g.15135  ORF Transcript_17153/g.15135 Transcript_17153/m.15135 type:complete len:136 (+) Transcript_17153:810-1217(+)